MMKIFLFQIIQLFQTYTAGNPLALTEWLRHIEQNLAVFGDILLQVFCNRAVLSYVFGIMS